jgi:putative ABC transport system permease protein
VIRLSGRFRSALIIGLQGIRARKLRTLLSMVSLFLGVLAVVMVQAGSEIAQQALLADLELTEGKDGTLQGYLPTTPQAARVSLDTVRGRADAVVLTSTQVIIGEPGVTPVNPGGMQFDQVGGSAYGGPYGGARVMCDANNNCSKIIDQNQSTGPPPGQAIELRLTAMSGDVRVFRPFRPVSGQWLEFSSQPSLSPRIVLNKEAAKGFSRYQVPAEMRIRGGTINPTPQIIGVVDDGSPQPSAYVRADELLNWMPEAALGDQYNGGMQILLSPHATEVAQILHARLVGAGIPAEQIGTEQPIRSRERLESGLALLRWVFLGMAGLVLLIGVAGILNVGLATVGERVEEFALRRAVGTPRLLLSGIVLAETLVTGLLTAGAAIGVAAVGVRVAGAFLQGRGPFPQNVAFPWQAAVAGIVAGLIAGILGGLVPAVRAARIPIATVMRA